MRLDSGFYRNNIVRIQERLKADGLDGILLLKPHNVYYGVGFFHQPTERPVGAYIPVDDDPVLLIPELEIEEVEPHWVEDVRTYFEYPGVIHPLVWMLNEVGSENLAVDDVSKTAFDLMSSAQPGLGVSGIVDEMRMTKTSQEIAVLRVAADYGDQAVDVSRRCAAEGLSEIDVHRRTVATITQRMQTDLPEIVNANVGLLNGSVVYGERAALPHGQLTHGLPKGGDTVIFGWGVWVGGYSIESERTLIVGEPTAEQREFFAVMREAQRAALDAIKPGVTCSHVDDRALSVIRKAGLSKYIRHRTGHGRGLEGHEPPWLDAGDKTVLEPGMVITVEPGIYVAGKGGYRHSDTVVVTEKGVESLTAYPREIENCIIQLDQKLL